MKITIEIPDPALFALLQKISVNGSAPTPTPEPEPEPAPKEDVVLAAEEIALEDVKKLILQVAKADSSKVESIGNILKEVGGVDRAAELPEEKIGLVYAALKVLKDG
jgi:hypothetical protein